MRNLGFVTLFLLGLSANAQISGPSTAAPGELRDYTFNNGIIYPTWFWSVGTGATVVSNTRVGSTYYLTVQWSTTQSVNLIFLDNTWTAQGNTTVDVTGTSCTPANPSTTLTVSNTCDSKTITYSGGAAGGITWYWQTTASGMSTTNSINPYTVTTSGTYYLRAKKNAQACWSSGSASVAVTVPASPSAPTVYPTSGGITYTTNACGSQTLTKSNSTWYWQGTNANGTDTGSSASANTYTATSSGMYYIRAYNGTCWGAATGVYITVDNPPAPQANTYTICEWEPMSFTATTAWPNLKWYDTNNNLLYTGMTYASNLNAGTTVFNVKAVSAAGCIGSNSATVTVTVNNNCDSKLNWVETTSFSNLLDGSNNPIKSGASKTYSDGFGNPLQSQSKAMTTNQVFASQPINDRFNQAALSTMAAPINSATFGYRHRFMTNASNIKYNANDFDLPINTNASGEVNNPKPVANGGIGTLGWYYSTSNTLEPRTPTTSYPYSRSYTPIGPDPTTSTAAGAGDQYKMGSGHEGKSDRYKILSTELSHYLQIRPLLVSTPSPYTDLSLIGYKYVTTDADGKRAVSFVDIDGRELASALIVSGTAPTFGYDYWSYNYYNDLGQLLATVAPQGVIIGNGNVPSYLTTFKYDHLGQLIETTSTDEGTTQYVYSTDGKIRFSQNQEQRNATPKRFSYTNYDYFGRLVESGEYTQSGTGYYVFEITSASAPVANSVLNIVDNDLARGLDIDGVTSLTYTGVSAKLDATRCTDYNFILYDKQATDFPTDALHTAQTYVLGEVTRTKNANSSTWYSYDEFGQLLWTKQSVPDLGYKTVDYTYDYFGNVTKVEYQKNQTDAYNHFYVYDADQRLTEAYSTTATSYNPTTDLRGKYFYYLHGPLKRFELANGSCKQGIDYVYTLNGSLKSINSSDPATDPGGDNLTSTPDYFGETLHYNDTDYSSGGYTPPTVTLSNSTYPNSYSGNLRAMAYNNATELNTGSTANARHIYGYQYDDRNQLANAQWGSLSNSTPTFGEAQREQIPGYDKNGNIQSLVRKGKQGQTIGNYAYQYETATNKVDYINHNGSQLVDYTYNTLGQMTRQNEGVMKDFKVTYNPYGLVKDVLDYDTGYLIQSYIYDDRGDLIKKATYYNKGTPLRNTWYVNDASGNAMAIYEQSLPSGSILQTEVPVYAAGRVGIYKPQATAYRYEVTDHLGNVRAVCGQAATTNYFENFEGATSTYFQNYSSYTNNSVDHTDLPPASVYQKVQIVNGGNTTGRVGVVKSLAVSPGDQVSISAYVRYLNLNSTPNYNALITSLAAAFGVSPSSTGEALKIYNGLNSYAVTVPNGDHNYPYNDDESAPKAFVTILLFDKNYVLQDAAWDQVSTTAATNHDLVTMSYTVKQPGYAYFFVSNEHFNAVDIYFDDVTVSHTQSPIVAGSDYYPYGLVMDGTDITDEKYRYGYQGQFSEKDLTTGWNEFELRMYDARFGRWLSPDPYGQFVSPYVAMGNNPTMSVDPDGGFCCGEIWLNGVKYATVEFVDQAAKSVGSTVARTAVSGGVNIIKNYSELNFNYNNGILTQDLDVPPTDAQMRRWQKSNFSDGPVSKVEPVPYSFDAEWSPQRKIPSPLGDDWLAKRVSMRPDHEWASDLAMEIATGAGGVELVGGAISGLAAVARLGRVTKGVSVIGPRAIYRQYARKIGAKYLNLNKAWSWPKNKKFLDAVINRGDDVIFAGKFNPKKLNPHSILAREIRYLERHGYRWAKDFSRLVKN